MFAVGALCEALPNRRSQIRRVRSTRICGKGVSTSIRSLPADPFILESGAFDRWKRGRWGR